MAGGVHVLSCAGAVSLLGRPGLCLKWENFSVTFDLVCFLFLPSFFNVSHSFISLLKFPFFCACCQPFLLELLTYHSFHFIKS